jgi:two-component system sensor histidine kinase CpxA
MFSSVYLRIVVSTLVTFALAFAVFWALQEVLERRGPSWNDPFFRTMSLIEEDAVRAYEVGGSSRLREHLAMLDQRLPGDHFVTDREGRDLASGEDRSSLLRLGRPGSGGPLGRRTLTDGRLVLVSPPIGSRYHFVTVVAPWFETPNLAPYFAAILLVIAGMGAVLAADLVRPLRRLRAVMDRFGRGDLSARTHATRRDEIGDLGRAFDEMGARIETLLAAERRLLQDVSHELRSPLARLQLALELARPDDQPTKTLDRIARDVDRLSALVQELLQLNRAEGDPAERSVGPVAIDALVLEVVDDCRIEAQAQGRGIEFRSDGGPFTIEGERELLRRAIENVVRNALDHAGDSGEVEVSVAGSSGHEIRIVVRDHGPGVPESMLDSIFDTFVRVETDRARASGGVGLGLAIARRSVSLHHGTIEARNAHPGLEVTIVLPTGTGGQAVAVRGAQAAVRVATGSAETTKP